MGTRLLVYMIVMQICHPFAVSKVYRSPFLEQHSYYALETTLRSPHQWGPHVRHC